MSVAGVNALRRKSKIEIHARLETTALEDGEHDLIGCSGKGRALEHDELSLVEPGTSARETSRCTTRRSFVDRKRRGDDTTTASQSLSVENSVDAVSTPLTMSA